MSQPQCAMPVERRDERTHLFLIATLYYGKASFPVRVRNLSTSGALIEGTCLPPVGTEIVLRRGNVTASGIAVWNSSGKSGLSFNAPVAVSPWLPAKESVRQRQIDQLVFKMKHSGEGADSPQEQSLEATKPSPPPVIVELERLQVELSQLADRLSLDVILVATHPEVQFLDEAVQRIGKIVNVIRVANE